MKNALVFHFKRKCILLKTQVHLIPNVRTFYFKRKCVSDGTKMSPLLNEYKGFLLLLDTLKNINQIKM